MLIGIQSSYPVSLIVYWKLIKKGEIMEIDENPFNALYPEMLARVDRRLSNFDSSFTEEAAAAAEIPR